MELEIHWKRINYQLGEPIVANAFASSANLVFHEVNFSEMRFWNDP